MSDEHANQTRAGSPGRGHHDSASCSPYAYPHIDPRGRHDFFYEHRKEIAWGVVIPATALVVTLFTWAHDVYMDIIDNIRTLDSLVAANTQSRLDHSGIEEYVRQRLDEADNEVRALQREVNRLRGETRPCPGAEK